MTKVRAFLIAAMTLAAALAPGAGLAQTPELTQPSLGTPRLGAPSGQSPSGGGSLSLSAAFFGEGVRGSPRGLVWRVFKAQAEADGSRPEQASAREDTPNFALPNGDYIVHLTWGLASATRRVTIAGRNVSERLSLNGGAMKVVGQLGDATIAPERLTIAVYVPDGGNPQAKLVARDVKPGQTVRLPEGTYHIVSTYLDASATPQPSSALGNLTGPANATNSVVEADVRIAPGRVTVTTLKHRAAQITLKLVNNPGGEALANTSFTVLTPGGDVLREMIGAFPSLVLAEGEYVAIARRDGRTFQSPFEVKAARDRDVEVLAR